MIKFSLVTPTFNSERYISETIDSVVSQSGDFEIEYIIMDNCSTDDTSRIVESYIESIESGCRRVSCRGVTIKLYSEKDRGMYDAINKGFSRATGDIFAWINSDDIYMPGAFSTMQRVFEGYDEIDWAAGVCGVMDECSTIHNRGRFRLFFKDWIEKGYYGPILYGINQESVFWRAGLWGLVEDKIGGYQLAGDYVTWCEFSKHHDLYSVDAMVSCFRRVKGQKSEDQGAYWREADEYLAIPSGVHRRMNAMRRLFEFAPKSVLIGFVRYLYVKKGVRIVSVDRLGNMALYCDRIPEKSMPQLWF